MQHSLYPPDWKQRARACLERAGYRCEVCGVRHRTLAFKRVQGRLQPYIRYLHACHINHDPHNPHAQLKALCPSCHMKHDRRSPQTRQPRRHGYSVITVDRLLAEVRSGGLTIEHTAGGSCTWHIAGLCGSGVDPLDALTQALHCLLMEVSS